MQFLQMLPAPRTLLATTLALATPLMASAQAQANWPVKPIRIVAAYAPGGGPERVIRTIADGMGKRLGQPVIIEYKPGASGNIGFAEVARGQADGYTWVTSTDTTWTINPHIYKNTGFKQADVVPVSLISSLSLVLACHPSSGVKTAQDLVARAKSGKPMAFASTGTGGSAHVTMARMMEAGRFEMTHVPYRGPGPAVADLIGGQVDCSFLPASTVQEHIKSGRLNGVAAATRYRPASLPDVPTLAEQGFKDFDATFYVGFFAPRGVPAEIRTRFENALAETIRTPEVLEAFAGNANRPEGMTADASLKELQRLSDQWQGLVRRLNVNLE
ncbi:tripartite tricarboxylate transporter substrate binding protein [Ramlibacter sp. AW1]|uniref:Tripartite tricarboxylate transporter substrate binding protein n=1 Tax=Ramlibacter aurantiacus TaxID=2801330 RepID=A0A936ZS99_9BURK|nr:tripartite tricarboxylate transporter substrate binding protein [Ramlibacter aurantiacus]MBL0420180.1 tripartite tricarboxylate transporter substrate binding protein [Ramlibacter aurantiacus]